MKKFIVAAAVAAIGAGAFASNCAPEQKIEDSAWVYQWKFSGKTTAGKTKAAAGSSSSCNPTDPANCTYRAPASLKIQGYTYACNPTCDNGNPFEFAFVEANEVFWMTKPWKASMSGGVTTEIANVIGKSKKQVEVAGLADFTEQAENVTYALTYAGLGKYKKGHITSVKGNFAGTASQAWAYNLKKDLCILAGYWDFCTLDLVCEGETVAFGKWSAKYLKSASKKFAKNGKSVKLPSWVKWVNAQ